MPGRNWFGRSAPQMFADAKRLLGLPSRPCVFISYRHHRLDRRLAKEAAVLLTDMGADIFFDEQDACLQGAVDDAVVALCIEAGLERSTALLGIVTEHTFSSPWIPYETGGERGRKAKFFREKARRAGEQFLSQDRGLAGAVGEAATATIAIAHWIDVGVTRVPGFVKLGVPLLDRAGLRTWIALLLEMHGVEPERDVEDVIRSRRLESLDQSLPDRRRAPPAFVSWEELAGPR